ncbi:hypothetical protein GCM10025331_70040 [Actinoplanes utahensis]|nr:hypothetical protein Aut01nite_75590 [Actinoplanes utahensis]
MLSINDARDFHRCRYRLRYKLWVQGYPISANLVSAVIGLCAVTFVVGVSWTATMPAGAPDISRRFRTPAHCEILPACQSATWPRFSVSDSVTTSSSGRAGSPTTVIVPPV